MLLFFLTHPAGVDSLLPLIEHGGADWQYAITTTSEVISNLLRDSDIAHTRFENVAQAERFMEDYRPHIVITDAAPTPENQQVVQIAKGRNITTVSILDFWDGYKKRYQIKPDWIIVPNEHVRQEMIKEGFAEDKLLPFGNPFFEKMKNYKPVFREEFQALLDRNKKNILFISQCFKEDGYLITQEEIFRDYVLSKYSCQDCNIIVKPHPREDSAWLSKYNVRVCYFSKNTYIYDFIHFCSLVVGVNSQLIYVSYLKNIPFMAINVEGMLKIEFGNPLIQPYKNSAAQIINFLKTI